MKRLEVGKHLVIDSSVCHGDLTFKGTRIPVETVLIFLADGRTIDWILSEWTRLTREAVEEAIRLAATALVERCKEAA